MLSKAFYIGCKRTVVEHVTNYIGRKMTVVEHMTNKVALKPTTMKKAVLSTSVLL